MDIHESLEEGRPAFHRRAVERVRKRGEAWYERGNRRTGNYLAHLAQALKDFNEHGMTEAVAFAYWALLSLFPLLVLAIIIATLIFGRLTIRYQGAAILSPLMPGIVKTLISDIVDHVTSRRVSYSVLSILSLGLSSTRLFVELQRSLSRIFQDGQARPWHLRFLWGILMIVVLAGLLLFSVNFSRWFAAMDRQIVGRGSPLVGIGAVLVWMLSNTLVMVFLFRFIPRRKIAWSVLVPFAAGAAVVYEISRLVYDWYLRNVADLSVVYGSVGAIIGLLLWLFVLGCILLICAQFAVATDNWRIEREQAKYAALTPAASAPPPIAEPEAPTALPDDKGALQVSSDEAAATNLTPLIALAEVGEVEAQEASVEEVSHESEFEVRPNDGDGLTQQGDL